MDKEVEGETGEAQSLRRILKIYGKGDVVFEEGAVGNEMYLIHSGKVKLLVGKKPGESTLAVLKPGDFFGEMALVDNAQRSATAVASEDDTQLIVLDREKFAFMVRQQPQFALSVMHTLCQRIRDLDKRLSEKGGAL